MTIKEEVPVGQFATALTERLEAKGMSIMDLAKALPNDTTYEHVRKLCRNEANPSRWILKDICKLLDLDEEEMWKLVVSDKIQKKYGNLVTEMAGKEPRFVIVERLLPKITDEQFNSMLDMLQGWAKRNRK